MIEKRYRDRLVRGIYKTNTVRGTRPLTTAYGLKFELVMPLVETGWHSLAARLDCWYDDDEC